MIENELAEELTEVIKKYIYKRNATMAKIIGIIEVVKIETVDKFKAEIF